MSSWKWQVVKSPAKTSRPKKPEPRGINRRQFRLWYQTRFRTLCSIQTTCAISVEAEGLHILSSFTTISWLSTGTYWSSPEPTDIPGEENLLWCVDALQADNSRGQKIRWLGPCNTTALIVRSSPSRALSWRSLANDANHRRTIWRTSRASRVQTKQLLFLQRLYEVDVVKHAMRQHSQACN